jgi:RNA polymerase sigma factor (sigma-70 family)
MIHSGQMDADLLLLERWRTGDRAAGEALFGRHFAGIYRFFEHKVGGEADELSQRTFLACVAARDAFRGHSSFRTYLYAIARNELYAHLRRMVKNDHVDFEAVSLATLGTSPSGQAARAQEAERIRDALRELPAEQQLLLELHYWHELDAAALAEVFGATAGAIRVRLLRARQSLRERMGTRVADEATAAGPGAGAGADADRDVDDRMARSLREPDEG